MDNLKKYSSAFSGLILCTSIFFVVLSNSLVHLLGAKYPTITILFYKSIVGSVCLAVAFYDNPQSITHVRRVKPLIIRTCVGIVGVFTWILSVQTITLSSASTLSLTSSFFSALGGYLFLKEKTSWIKNISIILGFCGAVFIISPHFSQGNFFYFLPLLSALCFGISSTLTRHLTKSESEWAISFYLFTAMALCALPFDARLPHTIADFFILLCIGALYAMSQFLFVRAYKYAEASYLAAFKFLKPPLHMIVGFFFFKEVLDVYDLIGFLMIVLSLKLLSLLKQKR